MNQPTLIGGRYELGPLLGRGGMAEVNKGVDTRLGRAVAIKRLRTDLASDATFQARFRREAQSSAALNHPAIVSVYDTGEEMATDGSGVSQPYIVMEYVAGRTLRDILREGRKILPQRAMEIVAGVLGALDYSHRSGIIHRDIKPGNVMLTPTGDVKVMDFGIARAISDASSTMTQTSAVVGTAAYLSPEQARGETVDTRSDVYSAGCLLYELLSGRPPFVGDTPIAVAYQHVREPADPPSDHDTEIDAEADAIVLKALEKRPEDRYQSAAEMRTDIERYLAGHPVQAVAPAGATQVTAPAVPAQQTQVQQVPPEPEEILEEEEPERSNKLLWIVVALLLLALLVGGYYLLQAFGPGDGEQPPEDAVEQVTVPDVVGMKRAAAERELKQADLTASVTRQTDDTAPKGEVLEQTPEGDTEVDTGSEVALVVSSGPEQVAVPEGLVGMNREQAEQALADVGLKATFTEEDSTEPAGQVLRTAPEAGQQVDVGSEVEVFYSAGLIEVPDVVGSSREEAITTLEDLGLKVDDVEEPGDAAAGEVLSSDPAAGSVVEPGSRVTITYSAGPETIPDVVGMNQQRATRTLERAGFAVEVVESSDTTEPEGTVIRQNPAPGGTAPQGTTVLIVVSSYTSESPSPEDPPSEEPPPGQQD